MPFAARGGFLHQPPAAAAGRRTGAADTNSSLTWTANSGSTTSSTYAKYGSTSLYSSTTTSEIYSANNPGIMNYGTGDFTLEWYMYLSTLAGQSASSDVCSNDTGGGFGFRLARNYNTQGLSSGANAKWINIFARGQADLNSWDISTGTSGDATWQTGKWYYCVLQRKSANMAFWLDGVLKTNTFGSGGGTRNFASSGASSNIKIGTADGGNGVIFYTDEWCWSNTWRYDDSGDIDTLPSAAFTVDEFTDQLMHMEGTNGGTSFSNDTG